jgi:hypothetical protein
MATEKRLIDANALIDKFWQPECRTQTRRDFVAMVNYAPTVDAVEVVRCKDCKHYRNHPNGLCYLHTEPFDNKQGYKGDAVCVEQDDFCSYGERKTNE